MLLVADGVIVTVKPDISAKVPELVLAVSFLKVCFTYKIFPAPPFGKAGLPELSNVIASAEAEVDRIAFVINLLMLPPP